MDAEITKDNGQNLIIAEPSINEFKSIINDIATNPNVLSLKNRVQHKNKSRYYHCLCVSFYSYAICKKLKLDYVSAARGAMLHDFYYYDWRDKNVEGQKKFDLNELEEDIIIKHMWPLTLRFPAHRESYIVTLVDKYCASREMIKMLRKKFKFL